MLTTDAQKLIKPIKQSKYRRGQSLRKLERRLKDKRLAGSKETIRRYMQTTLKWKSFKRRNVPKLTDAYKVRRVNFAKKFKDLDWSRVRLCSVMNRPSNYQVPNSKNDVVWGSQGSSVLCAPKVKFSPSVLVWGGMTPLGLTKLHIISNKTSITSSYYSNEILEQWRNPHWSIPVNEQVALWTEQVALPSEWLNILCNNFYKKYKY